MSTTAQTDALAAKIMRAKARSDAGTFSEAGRASRSGRIEGLIDAWEMFTSEEGTDENLAAAATRHNEANAAQAARDAADLHATDVVRVGNGRAEWVVRYADSRTLDVASVNPGRVITKRVPIDSVTLLAKGPRHVDFYDPRR